MTGPRLPEPVRALRRIARNRDLRRAELAWGSFAAAEAGYFVALAVLAYDLGGASTVGLVILVQMLAGAIAAPVGSVLADRAPRERVLLVVDVAAAIAVAALGTVTAFGTSRGVVLALVAVCAVAAAPLRPAHWALTPLLARTPEELVAANVSTSLLEGLAVLVGPALAGVGLVFAAPSGVFFACALAFAVAAILVAPVAVTGAVATPAEHPVSGALAGLRVAVHGPPRVVLGLFAAQTFVRGMLGVLIVVAAIEVLDTGSSGVGYLTAGLGAGALAGGLIALSLVGKARLSRPLICGLLAWGGPIAVIGASPDPWLAFGCLAVVGAGNSVFDVASLTLIQRLVADRVLGRVLGVLESAALAGIGVGALAAPLAVEWIGIRPALVVTGLLLPALVLLTARRIAALDDASIVPIRQLELLQRIGLFQGLASPALEQLARAAFPVGFPAGRRIIRQGDPGDCFYVLTSGEVEVACGGRLVAVLGPGDYFGEIALLDDVPRTATVTARTDVGAYALERPDFVAAVSGSRYRTSRIEALFQTGGLGGFAPELPVSRDSRSTSWRASST